MRATLLAAVIAGAIVACSPPAPTDTSPGAGGGGGAGAGGGGASCEASGASTAGAVQAVAGGDRHTCALFGDGAVKCWGDNNVGQLGLGDRHSRGEEPDEMAGALPAVALAPGKRATALAAGAVHTCALLDDGSVQCWGANTHGQLGLGDTEPRGDEPGEMGGALPSVDLGPGRTATALAAGWGHTCALLDGGDVKCWGLNATGALGLGDTEPRGDQPGEMGDSLKAIDLGSGAKAKAISAGSDHTCALLDGGALKCWGDAGHGQLGLGSTKARGDQPGEMGDSLPAVDIGAEKKVVALGAGRFHTCALLDGGAVKCWGAADEGQLGLGDTEPRGDQPGEMGDSLPATPLGGGEVRALSAGYGHTCVLLGAATVKCWGSNWDGQLGLGSSDHRGDGPGEMGAALPSVDVGPGEVPLALSAGAFHTCAVLDDGRLKCWGANYEGQLGLGDAQRRGDEPGEMGEALSAVDLSGSGGPGCHGSGGGGCRPTPDACGTQEIVAGWAHTCARLDDGRVKCWGFNGTGQLGLGDTFNRAEEPGEMGGRLSVVDLGKGRTATAMAARSGHTCAVLDDGGVKCWGDNAEGQLGLGDTEPRGDQPGDLGDNLYTVALGAGQSATALAAGYGHTCALLAGGSVKCWGQNHHGQLGLGDTEARGDGPGEMGKSLPAVDLGTGQTVAALAAGYGHTCALLSDGGVKCWGYNWNGQLGLGDTDDRGDQPEEMGNSLYPVDLGTGEKAVAIAAGYGHTCALLRGGSVKCWGDNLEGQLGLGDEASRGDEPDEMGDILPAVDLGSGRTAVAITAGYAHTCALLDDGSVRCWGWNHDGQLGSGDDHDHGDGPGEMGDALPVTLLGKGREAVALAAGSDHTCALLDDGALKCWGGNHEGQLGLGDTESRGRAPSDMGDDLPAVDLCTCEP